MNFPYYCNVSNTLTSPSATRTRILKRALVRYNKHGVAAVSSAHLATALGMSQGNLAYHFPRKADLVLALFAEREGRIAALFEQLRTDYLRQRDQPFGALVIHLGELFGIVWAYRFVSIDLGFLARKFPEIASAWQRENETMAQLTEALFRLAVTDGHVEPEPELGAFAAAIHRMQVLLNFSVADAAARQLDAAPYAHFLLEDLRNLCTPQGRALLPTHMPVPVLR